MEDHAIISLYLQRNERAIAESEAKYGAFCLTVAQNVLQHREDAEECVNDTWLRAWNRIPPELPQCLRAFFGKITRRLALDKRRTASREKRIPEQALCALDELSECLPDGNDTEDAVAARLLGEALNRFLGTLSKRDRDVFLCRYYFLCPTEQIARQHGTSESYVRNLISRTRKKLKAYLEKEGFSI